MCGCVEIKKNNFLHLLLEVSVHSAMVNAIRIFQVSVIMQLLGSIIFFFSEIQYYMGGEGMVFKVNCNITW